MKSPTPPFALATRSSLLAALWARECALDEYTRTARAAARRLRRQVCEEDIAAELSTSDGIRARSMFLRFGIFGCRATTEHLM
jgi:DNA-binding response OmpR family regulator